ncbi:MAG: hypothetical protein JG781_1535 [Peptococcaceae bacterium]|jgi:hypothetical protein|nr:hypothetical protein [Peptococcaceae bacterium]
MRKIIYYVLAVIVFQLAIYQYLEAVVFAPTVSFSQQAVISGNSTKTTLSSSENTAFALVSGKEVKIVTNDGFVKEVLLNEEGVVTYFNLFEEKNLALFGLTPEEKPGTSMIFQGFNLQNRDKPVTWEVDSLSKGTKITEVAFSGPANVLHVLMQSGNYMTVYRSDTGNRLRRVDVKTSQIRRIAGLSKQDILVFDSASKGAVYTLNNKGQIKQIQMGKGSYALIGVDREDKIYLGKLVDGELVSSILVGEFNGKFNEVRKLASPVPISFVKVGEDGRVVFN